MKGKLLHWEFWDCERGGAGVGGAGKLDMGRFEGESDAKDTDLIICRGLSVLHFPSIFVAVTQVLTLYCACTGLASASCRVDSTHLNILSVSALESTASYTQV